MEKGMPLVFLFILLLSFTFVTIFSFQNITGNVLLTLDIEDNSKNRGMIFGFLFLGLFLILSFFLFKYFKSNNVPEYD